MSLAFAQENRFFAMPYSLHPASNSSLPILHTDIRFLFQVDYFQPCIALFKISNYFLTYRIKVILLSLMSKMSRINPNFNLMCFCYFWLLFYIILVLCSCGNNWYDCWVNWGDPWTLGSWHSQNASLKVWSCH